jgi:hypothetical protein
MPEVKKLQVQLGLLWWNLRIFNLPVLASLATCEEATLQSINPCCWWWDMGSFGLWCFNLEEYMQLLKIDLPCASSSSTTRWHWRLTLGFHYGLKIKEKLSDAPQRESCWLMSELESWMNLERVLARSCIVSNVHRLGKKLVASSPVFRRCLLQVQSQPPHRRRNVVSSSERLGR